VVKKAFLTRSARYLLGAIAFGAAGALAVVAANLASATTPDPTAQGIQQGLSSFATDAVSKLGLPATATPDHLDYLTKQIPLSSLAPLSSSGLDLADSNNPLAQAITDASSSLGSVSDFADALDSINATYAGVHVTLGCGDNVHACADRVAITGTGPYAIKLKISITRDVAVPLSLATDLQDLKTPDDATHNLTVHLSVASTLSFGYDATRPAGHQFFLNSPAATPAELDITANIDSPSPDASFSTDLGFTKVSVTPHVTTASVGLAVKLMSPHSAGDSDQDRITSYDWQTTALQDLVTVSRSGVLSATLALDTTLTAANPDVTVTVSESAADGFVPHFSAGGGTVDSLSSVISNFSLSDFLNVTPTQILSGLGQFAASVQAIQTAADVHLPFLQNGLTTPTGDSALKIVNDLVAALAQQTVVCGTTDTIPPTGSLLGLPAGTPVYCIATTTDTVDAGTTTWSSLANTADPGDAPNNLSGAAADGTVAAVPSKKAVFKTHAADVPPVITANYKVGGQTKGASMPVPTAQDLFDQLTTAAGLGDTVPDHAAPGLTYDSATHTLKFHLVKKIATPAQVQAALDFADRLKTKSGLFGLSADSTADVKAQASGVVLDLTFGVILTKDLTDISTHSNPPTLLDRFFVAGPAGGSPLSVDDASVTATVKLHGQVGFLGITGAGASVADCNGQSSAAFCIHKDDASKPILSVDLPGAVDITVGGNTISDVIPIPSLLANVADHVAITPNLKFAGGLKISADLGGTELAHGGVTFSWPVDAIAELTSASQLDVQTDADFSSQLEKFWEMAKDDPTALLKVIIDALRDLAQREATTNGSSGSVFDTQLPLINTTPRKLMQQFTRLQTALDEISTGSGALVECTNVTGQAVVAPAPKRDATSAVAGDVIRCDATITTAAPTSVKWTVVAGGASIPVTDDQTLTTIGASPTTKVEFTLPAGVSGFANSQNSSGYHVHVDYSDPSNNHSGDLPSLSSPPTLQDFAAYLAVKLGLPPNVLTLGMISTPKPGGGGDVTTLKFGLKYDICTADTDLVGSCGADGVNIATPKLPINASLGSVGPLTPSIQTAGTFKLEFNAHAQLDVGFPLDGGIGTLPTPEILGSTSASIAVGAGSDDLGAKASLGPLSIDLGSLATKGHDGTDATVLKKFQVGGKVTASESGATPDKAYTPADFASGLDIAFANNGTASDCGNVDPHYGDEPVNPGDPDDPTPAQDMNGFACAAATMNLNGTFIGDLGFKWDNFADAPTIVIPDDLASRIADAAFNVDFLLKALPQLLDDLKNTLSNANGTKKLPVIGDALDAGANLVDTLNNGLVKPVTNGLSAAIGAVGSPSEIVDKVDQFLFDQLGSDAQGATGAKVGILLDSNGDNVVNKDDVGLKLMCKDGSHGGNPYDCSTSTETGTGDGSVFSIQDASFDIAVGQGFGTDPAGDLKDCATGATDCTSGHDIPFDIGLDGLPFRVTGKLVPSVGWKARLNFGMNRNGPYLMVNHTGNDVQVGAAIHLGDPGGGVCTNDSHTTALLGDRDYYSTYKTSTNCLHGVLGFLEVRATDTDGTDPSAPNTGLQLLAGVKLNRSDVNTTSAAGVPLQLTDFDKLAPEFVVKASADANLLIHAGILGTGNGFPSVYGVLHAHWGWGFTAGGSEPGDGDTLDSSNTPTPGVSFEHLNLDIGELLHNYLQPIFKQIQDVTSPLKPVIDVLQAPIPVVSQLAELVGQPPVTLIDLAEAASGSDLSFVKSLISFLHFIQNFDVSQSGLLNLDFLTGGSSDTASGGAFTVDKNLLNAPQPSSSAGDLVKNDSTLKASDATAGVSGANATNTVDSRPSTFGVPGLSIPVLKSPSNIFKLLMGSDITLVEYDFGTLSATAGFEYSFGPFMVGPVPVSIVIGGSIQINGNLELGYDTTGLREVINGGPADKLLDGLFFDTYRNGKEVPVIQLIGTVYAGAEVDLEIIKAGIEAGLQLTINFFFDDPTPDGKMSFQDIGNKLSNPICLFRVSGSLDAFIKAFVEINLFFFSDRFEFTILQIHLLDFSAACTPPSPEPASVESHVLQLNIGPRASLRNINTDEKDEKIVVRPLPPSTGKQFGVTIFGAYKEYGDTNAGGAEHITSIYADGADGKDDIELLPGAQSDGTVSGQTCTTTKPCTLPFDTPAELRGGTDDDNIIAGDGNDTLDGGPGADKISGNGGTDSLAGGGGGDQLDGGLGTDTLCSGDFSVSPCKPAAESTTESGGPGDDHLYGSTAADQLNGGPGLDPNAKDPDNQDNPQKTYGQTKTAQLDGDDYIVGYAGQDQITGGFGNDTIFGDEVISNDFGCTQDGAAQSADHAKDDAIDAGAGSDKVWGGSGEDTIKGGSGTQGVVAQNDNDFLCGNGGNDNIEGDPADGSATGNDVVMGGSGNDVLTGGPGNDYVNGGEGNDSASGGANDDVVLGGTGRDYVSGGAGKDIVIGESATVTEYNSGTGALNIDHSGSSTVMSGKVSGVYDTSSSGSQLDCTNAYNQGHATAAGEDPNSDCVDGAAGDDALFGGAGADTVTGDDGDDWMSGGNDNDKVDGGLDNDTMYGDAGDDMMTGDSGVDTMYGGLGQDEMHGGLGADYMEGNQDADNVNGDQDDDLMLGGSSTSGVADAGDTMDGGAGADTVVGDNGEITGDGAVVIFDDCTAIGGNDTITGDESADWLFGGNGNDTINGGDGADYIEGNAGVDAVHGDDNADHILGGSSSDTSPGGGSAQSYTLACDDGDNLYGDAGDDVMLGDNGLIAADGTTTMSVSDPGTFGDDVMRGSSGQDQMYGELGSDTMTGDADQDYLLGDLGAITAPTSGPATWPGGAPNHKVALISPNSGSADVIYGGSTDDHAYGGAADDTLQGGAGDDYLEGNGGQDSMYGLSDDIDGSTCSAGVSAFDCAQAAQASSDITAGATDQDDMIGGSSGANPDANKSDAGEAIMKGNLAQDVILGDNGTIVRTVDGVNWAQDPIAGGAKRDVTLTYGDRPDCSTGVCGGDTIEGDAANDRIYGEGGNDTIDGDATGHAISGAPGDDYVEGNQNVDTIHGNDGRDDLIGGSSEIASGNGDAAVGRPDAGDIIDGDARADVIAGDNAVVSKLGLCPNGGMGDVITQRPGMDNCQRTIRLLDLGTSAAGTYGDDTINGGDDVDVAFGQAGTDTIHGNAGDDYAEGNQDTDAVYGDAGQDDLIGGSSHVASGSAATKSAVGEPDTGDTIYGGDDEDVVLGDNGAVLRIGTTAAGARANTLEDATKGRGMTQRTIALYDLGDSPAGGTSGGDYAEGNAANDVILGEGGNDRVKGNAGDDYVEGNQGLDAVDGNAGDDDLIGGSSTPLNGNQSVDPTFGTQPAPTDATAGQPDGNDAVYGGAGDDLVTGDNAVTSRVGAVSTYLANRLSTSSPGNLVTPRFLQMLDLKNGATFLTPPASTHFGNDWVSGGPGTDIAFGQDGSDAVSGGGGDDYLEGNGAADVMRGDLRLSDPAPQDPGVSVQDSPTDETTVHAFGAVSPAWPTDTDPASTADDPASAAGQDDVLGGSSIPGFRDGNDFIEGDGEADFVLGDNGTLARDVSGAAGSQQYAIFAARYPTGSAPANAVIIRHHDQAVNIKYGVSLPSTRFCTQPSGNPSQSTACEVAGASGADRIYGDAGDDTLWGQDGDDYMRGGANNDDMYGETGKDRMFGDGGQDAMLGDRGGIVDTYLNGTPGGTSTQQNLQSFTVDLNQPPAIHYKGFVGGTVDRRVDMLHDVDGAAFVGTGTPNPMPLNGMKFGDDDVMRGGTGRDSLHGEVGDDVMNGDSGGDTLFGDDGSDVMWGGRGCDPASPEDTVPAGQTCLYPNDATQEGTAGSFANTRDAVETVPGTGTPFTLPDGNVDYLFGGHGGTSTASINGAAGADLIDWRPRGSATNPGTTCATGPWPVTPGTGTTVDPCTWFVLTNTDDDPATSANPASDPKIQNNQHHQGIDWQYGGWDRDVHQADVADNGPNAGDRLLDWSGAYNLYTHCNSAYGGFNDVRELSPDEQSFLQKFAFSVGAGQAGSADITTSGTSGFDELALVYTSDVKNNTGKAYPSTPGHFDSPNSCGL